MAAMIFLDTHVVVWLYAGDVGRIPRAARQRIEAQDLLISPMVTLELQYLKEAGRLKPDAHRIISGLTKTVGLQVCDLAFDQILFEALAQDWTRDPFDRIIVAHAAARNLPLLTKDATILAHYKRGCWE